MPYAITWVGTETCTACIGPILYKYVKTIVKGKRTRDKVPLTKEESQTKCDAANIDPVWGGLHHEIIRVKGNHKQEGENSIEKISEDGKFWRENFDKIMGKLK